MDVLNYFIYSGNIVHKYIMKGISEVVVVVDEEKVVEHVE